MCGEVQVVAVPLNPGQRWAWDEEDNIMCVSDRLDVDGRVAAVDDMLAEAREKLTDLARKAS